MLVNDASVIIRICSGDVSVFGRASQGVRLMRLADDTKVVAVAKLPAEEDEEERNRRGIDCGMFPQIKKSGIATFLILRSLKKEHGKQRKPDDLKGEKMEKQSRSARGYHRNRNDRSFGRRRRYRAV